MCLVIVKFWICSAKTVLLMKPNARQHNRQNSTTTMGCYVFLELGLELIYISLPSVNPAVLVLWANQVLIT